MARTIIRPGLLEELADKHGILTDEAMADLGNVSIDEFRAIRAGERVPSWRFTAKIGTAFGLGMHDLLVITDDPAPRAVLRSRSQKKVPA